MTDRPRGTLDRRTVLLGGLAAGLSPGLGSAAETGGETLYNGIRLPSPWPPHRDEADREPMKPPYLANPPAVIPIDLGRQLFVDDFLIDRTNLQRVHHTAEYHPQNPVLRPDRPWEQTGTPTAMAFSDGAWYDPRDQLFKLWYMGGEVHSTCYATSKDGIQWDKPSLDVVAGTNVVLPQPRDSVTVWLDHEEHRPERRFKLARSYTVGDHWALRLYGSADGIHWGEPQAVTGSCGDRTTVFWNPFRKVWVYSLRHGWGRPRRRRYVEAADFFRGAGNWKAIGDPPYWIGADRLDLPREDMKVTAELYNLDAVAYESLMLGFFTIWRGQKPERPKPNEVDIAYSRDGFHWSRPDRRGFLAVSENREDWNLGNVQSVGGGCLMVGDRLYFYCSGRSGPKKAGGKGENCTGLAFLRRDGFASMHATSDGGVLTTRPVRFSGKHLFVNVEASHGELTAELLDERGSRIAPASRAHCVPIRADKTLQLVEWKGLKDLSRWAGTPVRFRFYLTHGDLYSFWVSPERSGISRGYVAAGGPGFGGPVDSGQ